MKNKHQQKLKKENLNQEEQKIKKIENIYENYPSYLDRSTKDLVDKYDL